MSDSSQFQEDDKSLTEEDLRFLARRHAIIMRKFRARRERERNAAEQQSAAYSLALHFAAMMSGAQQQARASNAAGTATSAAERRAADVPAKKTGGGKAAPSRAGKKAEDSFYPTPVDDFAEMHFAAREETATERFWRKIGGGGLAFSLLFHAALIIIAIFWVVSVYVAPEEAPPTFFATGSGGGRGGERPSYADVQASRRSRAGKIAAGAREHKIVSSARTAKLVLPEMPDIGTTSPLDGVSAASALRGFGAAGALSSGSGNGLGGGIGKGMGVGVGNARNFVGKFKTTQKILGTNVTASRLAVYMDNSGSMTAVIPVVRQDILKKFPTADVYEFFGCGIGRISEVSRTKADARSWERKKNQLLKAFDREKSKPASRTAQKRMLSQKKTRKKNGVIIDSGEDSAWRKKLSEFGTALLDEWSGTADFYGMDLGSWLNMTLTEGGYDAMIVFADFQDYRDGGLAGEAEVLERWIGLAREHGQRLYFFTTEMMPQTIFRRLAELSGGEIALPKEVSKNSYAAEQTARDLKKMKRRTRVPVSEISKKRVGGVPAVSEDEEDSADDFPQTDDESEDESEDAEEDFGEAERIVLDSDFSGEDADDDGGNEEF